MGFALFKRGVHPSYKKYAPLDFQIKTLQEPDEVVLPLSMHIGRPAALLVKPGQVVGEGELIAEKSAHVSANIHSSITGVVKTICNVKNTLGKKTKSVVIARDKNAKPVCFPVCESDSTIQALTPAQILSRIEQAGIVGLGGAGFPTSVKMDVEKRSVSHLIVNACECEPFLQGDDYMMVNYSTALRKALLALNRICGAENIVFVIEDDKPKAIAAVQETLAGAAHVKTVPTRYPQGGEKQLIHTVTGKELALGQLPIELGVVVVNVSTLYAIYEALYLHKPLIERTVCVTDDEANFMHVVKAKVGMRVGDVLTQLGIDGNAYEKIILGGPMMGQSQGSLDVPVCKTTGAILLMKHPVYYNPTPCIRCGRCVKACPQRLMPFMIASCSEKQDYAQCAALDNANCIECGCCSYVCPAKRPLMQLIKSSKAALAMRAKK